jgi:hypothetical protein
MVTRPDPRAELAAFTAMVLDLARVDPERKPGAAVTRWHRELAALLGLPCDRAATNRDLLRGALTMNIAQRDAGMDPVPVGAGGRRR